MNIERKIVHRNDRGMLRVATNTRDRFNLYVKWLSAQAGRPLNQSEALDHLLDKEKDKTLFGQSEPA